jgi:hypothetical protein
MNPAILEDIYMFSRMVELTTPRKIKLFRSRNVLVGDTVYPIRQLTAYICSPKAYRRWTQDDVQTFEYVKAYMDHIYPEARGHLRKYKIYKHRSRSWWYMCCE